MHYLVVTFFLFISACGFTPVYGDKNIITPMNNIEVAVIPDREGQIVRNHLIDSLYRHGNPDQARYVLSVSPIEEQIVEIGIDEDDDASRAQLRHQATMRLVDKQTGKNVLTRVVRATAGYNILAGQFTTFISEEDARKQALQAISDNVVTQLGLYLNRL